MAYTYKHGDRPLEGYTIQRAVGRGGFGEVYYALADSGKQVALKYLRENAEVELRGIAHVMNLKSPHLVTIYDVRKNEAGDPFVVMEYVSGPSLRDLLVAEADGLGRAKAAFFLDGIARGLSYLHDRGIVHRDLKPGNIFYDDGYVKIGDYGLSKHIAVSRHSGQTVSVGTVHYMAPEIGSGNYTKAIDIYALGVILYEMLTGRLPFSGGSMAEILMRHLSDAPDVSGIPQPFAAVIARALAKNPGERFGDVNEMVDAVTSAVGVGDELRSFDPATITRVPRPGTDGAADSPTRTVGHAPKPPPVPVLDARSALDWSTAPERLRKKAEKLEHKLAKKLARLEARIGPRRTAPADRAAGAHADAKPQRNADRGPGERGGGDDEGRPAAVRVEPASRRAQLSVLLIVAGGIALGLGILSGEGMPEAGFSLLLYMIGATVGSLVGYFAILRRSLTRNSVLDRFVIAGVAALFMIPAAAFADEVDADFVRLFVPVVAALFVCDWSQRIEMGRRGHVDGGEAFWPAVVGLVGGAVTDAPHWIAAGLCAAVSLLTQAGAAAWSPLARAEARRGGQTRARGLRAELRGAASELVGEVGQVISGVGDEFRQTFGVRGGEAEGGPQAASPRDAAVESPVEPRVPVRSGWRALWAVASVFALVVSVGCFFVLVLADVRGRDDRTALLYFTLSGLAWGPFVWKKAFQRFRQPAWRGTLRFLCVSAGLNVTALAVAMISFQRLQGEELGAAIFALVAGAIVALVCLCIPGSSAGPRRAPEVGEEEVAGAGTAPPQVIDAAAPSFAGRTANAGLSFLGKLLLLAGLTGAVLYSGLEFETGNRFRGWSYHDRVIRVVRNSRESAYTIAPIALFAPLMAGSLLLVVSRRNDGAAHFLRGFAGCAAALVGVIMSLGPGREGLLILFSRSQDLSGLDSETILPLAATGLLFMGSVGLLFWPRASGPRKIVV